MQYSLPSLLAVWLSLKSCPSYSSKEQEPNIPVVSTEAYLSATKATQVYWI